MTRGKGTFRLEYQGFEVKNNETLVHALNLARNSYEAFIRSFDVKEGEEDEDEDEDEEDENGPIYSASDEILTELRGYLERMALLFEDSISPFEFTEREMAQINHDIANLIKNAGQKKEAIRERRDFYTDILSILRGAITREARESIKVVLESHALHEKITEADLPDLLISRVNPEIKTIDEVVFTLWKDLILDPKKVYKNMSEIYCDMGRKDLAILALSRGIAELQSFSCAVRLIKLLNEMGHKERAEKVAEDFPRRSERIDLLAIALINTVLDQADSEGEE